MSDLDKQKEKIHSIKALGDTEGGKALVSILVEDVVDSIHKLVKGNDVNTEIAYIKANMKLLRHILNVKEDEEEIDKLIAEALLE